MMQRFLPAIAHVPPLLWSLVACVEPLGADARHVEPVASVVADDGYIVDEGDALVAVVALSVAGDVHASYAEGLRTTDAECMFPYSHDFGDAADPERATAVVLQSGEFSIHSIHLVHGGGPNPSNRDRIGFAMRYISADTRCLSGIDSVTAIRGDCERDYYLLEPRADGEFTAAGLLALERALQYPSGFGEAKRTR